MEAFPKKTILIVIASVAGFLLLAALLWFLIFNGQFRVYQDDQYKFWIRYPGSWKVIVHPRENVAVIFVRPRDTALDTLQENFNVTVQPTPRGILTITDFSNEIKRQMTGTFGKSIKIVEDKPVQWGWRQGHEIVIEALKPDHLKMVNAWVLRGDQAYIMTFLGNIEKYSKDGIIVDEIVRSLQLQ